MKKLKGLFLKNISILYLIIANALLISIREFDLNICKGRNSIIHY
jgi:hypothetical protein